MDPGLGGQKGSSYVFHGEGFPGQQRDFKFVVLSPGPTSADVCALVDCQGFVNTATAFLLSPGRAFGRLATLEIYTTTCGAVGTLQYGTWLDEMLVPAVVRIVERGARITASDLLIGLDVGERSCADQNGTSLNPLSSILYALFQWPRGTSSKCYDEECGRATKASITPVLCSSELSNRRASKQAPGVVAILQRLLCCISTTPHADPDLTPRNP